MKKAFVRVLAAAMAALCLCIPASAADPGDLLLSVILGGVAPARELAHSFTFVPDPGAAGRVEQMKNNKKLREVIEQESADPEAWWEWVESLPVDSDITLDQEEVLEWLEVYSKCTPEERASFSRNFIR